MGIIFIDTIYLYDVIWFNFYADDEHSNSTQKDRGQVSNLVVTIEPLYNPPAVQIKHENEHEIFVIS